jgi:magnesium chelatase subunit I
VKDRLAKTLSASSAARDPVPGIVGLKTQWRRGERGARVRLSCWDWASQNQLIRMLVTLLDEYVPYIAGCEIRDHPLAPICSRAALLREKGYFLPGFRATCGSSKNWPRPT